MLVVLALALVLGAQPAQPAPLDTVTLTVGSVLRGTIVQDAPAGNVVIVLESGESWTIPRSTIASVEYAPGRPRAPAEAPPPREPAPPPAAPVLVAPAPGTQPAAAPQPDAGSQAAPQAAPEEVRLPFFTVGVSAGLAVPVGKLDASGLNLGATVSPMLTFGLEVGIRPVALLEVGLLTVFGIGTAFGPLNDLCIEAGASCDAANLFLGPYVRVSPIPLANVSPWLMASGGWELLSLKNSYEDSIDLSGWLLGGTVGVDVRFGTFMLSFFAGAHLGEYGSVSTRGYLPEISIAPALHGWIDTGVRAAGGF